MAQSLSDFIAGLTWPLRGRRVVQEVEKKLREELHVLRWQELQAVRLEMDAVRQMLQEHFQAQESRFHALEKLMRGNLSHLHDRIAEFQESEKEIRKEISTALDQIAIRSKTEDVAR